MASKLANIQKLKGSENYQGWVIMAKAYLIREGLQEAITNSDPLPDRVQEKSLGDITLLCEYNVAHHVVHCTTGFEAWKTLKNLYNSDGFTSKYLLLQKLYSTKQADFESVEAYVSKLKSLIDNLESQDLKMPKEVNIAWLLQNLEPEFDAFVG